MRTVVEKDMEVYGTGENAKIILRCFANYPLLGNALIIDAKMKKIHDQAKKALDILVDNPRLINETELLWHMSITLSVIDHAKRWNPDLEAKFTKYITLQFGYRDDSGRVWGVLSQSIYKALSLKKRLFLEDETEKKYYETVMLHAFGPEKSWYPVFDLLFDFLKDNLRWLIIADDPIIDKMVDVLRHRMEGMDSEEEELLISTKKYSVRLGARRLIQKRPKYTTVLFTSILQRILALTQGVGTEPETYCDYIVEQWFTDRINKSLKTERKKTGQTALGNNPVALTYDRIRIIAIVKKERLYLRVPSVRLDSTNHKNAEIKVYDGKKLVAQKNLEIYGNELGESVEGCDVHVPLNDYSKLDIRAEVICDDKSIFDSGKTLRRKLFIFKNATEKSVNSLKPGEYDMILPVAEFDFKNVVIKKSGKWYIKAILQDDFSIIHKGKIMAMDAARIKGVEIIEPGFIKDCCYEKGGEVYDVTAKSEVYTVLSNQSISREKLYVINGRGKKSINRYQVEEAEENTYEISLYDLSDDKGLYSLAIYDAVNDSLKYKKTFLAVDGLTVSFNRKHYFKPEDFKNAVVRVSLDDHVEEYTFYESDETIRVKYNDGQLVITIPKIQYALEGIKKIYPGNNIWKGDISKRSKIKLIHSSEQAVRIKIGETQYRENEIKLYDYIKNETSSQSYFYPVYISAGKDEYKIAQLVVSEMFSKNPEFGYEDNELKWDGGLYYIGDSTDALELQLYDSDKLVYSFELNLGIHSITLPNCFIDAEYFYCIVRKSNGDEHVLAQDSQFFGNPNKTRFLNKTVMITEVTEDKEEGTKPQKIKPVYIENITYISREYVPSEEGVFDIYTGKMYFIKYDGEKRYYSNKYSKKKNISFYKVNPVKIIYINDRYLRIINEDDEGLYAYENIGTQPGLEITDREPARTARDYKDILFYVYDSRAKNDFGNNVKKHLDNNKERKGLFSRFILNDQRYVIESDANARIIINSGPGTGKTWTLIERIIHLINNEGVDPEEIIVLCFSRAAVEVIKERLKDAVNEERVPEIAGLTDIRTFDSFASQLLYWVKNDSELDNLEYYDIGKMNYDERIELFTSLIREEPELISQCSHLFVDEVQDLVRGRARMILGMIRYLPENAGITLLGDSCQSIYDYQVGRDAISSIQFYRMLIENVKGFEYISFERNYRQTSETAWIGDTYRKAILSGDSRKCDIHLRNSVVKRIPEFKQYDVMDIGKSDLEDYLIRGTVGILTRTNGQALKISAALKKVGIDHTLKRRLSDNSLAGWIGLLFSTYRSSSLSEKDFYFLFEQTGDEDEHRCKEMWQAIQETARSSAERVGVRDFLSGLMTNAKKSVLYLEEKKSNITVTNIHRGKGKEFDTVLVEDDIFYEEEKGIEEHKVCYVALTRAKTEILRVNAQSEYIRIDKEGDRRCFKADYVGYNKQRLTNFEVGLSGDIDLRSFVRLEGVQEYIRTNHHDMIGKGIYLLKDRHFNGYVRYMIIISEEGVILGYTSERFAESLDRALRRIYRLSYSRQLYNNVFPERINDLYIDDIISTVDSEDGQETGVMPHAGVVVWNAVSILGYGNVTYA